MSSSGEHRDVLAFDVPAHSTRFAVKRGGAQDLAGEGIAHALIHVIPPMRCRVAPRVGVLGADEADGRGAALPLLRAAVERLLERDGPTDERVSGCSRAIPFVESADTLLRNFLIVHT